MLQKIRTAIIFAGEFGFFSERNNEIFSDSSTTPRQAAPRQAVENQSLWDSKKIGGLTVLERIILSSQKAGVKNFLVVGLSEGEVEKVTSKYSRLGIELSRINAGHYSIREGLKGETDFFLISGDCVFEPNTLRELSDKADLLNTFTAVAAIKKNINGLDSLGNYKNSPVFYPGLFLGGIRLIDTLEPETSLTMTEMINKICGLEQLGYHYMSDSLLENVATEINFKIAEKKIYRNLVKKTDGFLARHINRKISIFITKFLVDTELSPNRITLITLGIGLIGAFFFAVGGYWPALIGSLIFQFSSITDGCDGEIARLKFMESRFGGWLDIVCDNITHLAVFGGIAYGEYRLGPAPYLIWCGCLAVLGTLISFLIVAFQLYQKETGGGPFFTTVLENGKKSGGSLESITELQDSLARRDFTYLLILFAFFGYVQYFLVLTAIGSNFFWLLLAYSKYRLSVEK